MQRKWSWLVAALLLLTMVLLSGCGSTVSPSGSQVVTDGDVTVQSGQQDGDMLILGGNVVIPADATVNGDVAVAGGNVKLDGTITGDVAVMGGNVSGEGQVEGELSAIGGSVHLPNDRSDRNINPGLPTEGSEPPVTVDSRSPSLMDRFLGFIGSVVSALVQAVAFGAMGFALALFLPRPLERTRRAAMRAPLPSVGVGCLALPVATVVAILIGITIIGLPISALIFLLMLVVAVLGWLALGSLLGERMLRSVDVRRPQLAAAAAIGAASLSLLGNVIGHVPVIGWLIVTLLWSWGIGAAVLTYAGTREYASVPAGAGRYTVPPPPPPASRRPSGDLYADLASDLGLDERDLRRDDPTDERPVWPDDQPK